MSVLKPLWPARLLLNLLFVYLLPTNVFGLLGYVEFPFSADLPIAPPCTGQASTPNPGHLVRGARLGKGLVHSGAL